MTCSQLEALPLDVASESSSSSEESMGGNDRLSGSLAMKRVGAARWILMRGGGGE